jgi:AcrR family transcriptional regulator
VAARTQAQRTAASRAAIIDATISSLVELGYANTTISRIQERSGLARGTLLHHFGTRADLLAAVVHDVAHRRMSILPTGAAPQATGWDAAVDLIWHDLQSNNFLALLELWVAARTDTELRSVLVPLERAVFEAVHKAISTVVADDDPRAPSLVQFTIDLLTGAQMASLLADDARPIAPMIQRWRRALPVLLGRADADQWV